VCEVEGSRESVQAYCRFKAFSKNQSISKTLMLHFFVRTP